MAEANPLINEKLLALVIDVARAENREPAEVIEDALERYLKRERLTKLFEQGKELGRASGHKPEDVERLIDELNQSRYYEIADAVRGMDPATLNQYLR